MTILRGMTVNERMLLEMSDLAAVQFECITCQTAVVIQIEKFKHPPTDCPSCGVAWFRSRANEDTAVRQFVGLVRELSTISERVPVRLRVELVASPRKGGAQ